MDTHQRGPIPVVADDRESRSGLIGRLRACPEFDIRVERLAVGDYLVDGRLLFERKTLSDLVGSITSGRLFKQALRLASVENWRPVLLLEGSGRELAGCGMRWEAVQGALITVTLFIGLPMLRSRSMDETVSTFLFAASQGRTIAGSALPRAGFRPKGKRALQVYLLQGLPGIGPERAVRLLEHFGSVEAVLTADPEDLVSVPGIGPRTARAMRWAVEEERVAYST